MSSLDDISRRARCVLAVSALAVSPSTFAASAAIVSLALRSSASAAACVFFRLVCNELHFSSKSTKFTLVIASFSIVLTFV